MRLPGIRRLGSANAWWNPLWIEEFELITPNRSAVCERLLAEKLPPVGLLAVVRRSAFTGYVWSGGFTVYRVPPWHSGWRPMGTGTLTDTGPFTRISLSIAIGRWAAYGFAGVIVVFVGGAVLSAATAVQGRFEGALLAGVLALTVGPLMFFALSAGRGERDAPHSRESALILSFLQETLGAQIVGTGLR